MIKSTAGQARRTAATGLILTLVQVAHTGRDLGRGLANSTCALGLALAGLRAVGSAAIPVSMHLRIAGAA